MKLSFHVHGLWVLGAICLTLGSMIAGNVTWVEGTTDWSYGLSVVIAFILLLTAGIFWISAAVNAKQELR